MSQNIALLHNTIVKILLIYYTVFFRHPVFWILDSYGPVWRIHVTLKIQSIPDSRCFHKDSHTTHTLILILLFRLEVWNQAIGYRLYLIVTWILQRAHMNPNPKYRVSQKIRCSKSTMF